MQAEPTKFVFLDVEATGLDHSRHEMTEVAWIVRHEDGHEEERQFFPFHTTDGADTDALELTRYEERIAPRRRTPMKEWLPVFLRDANRAVIVGAVPDFDVRHIEIACRKLGLDPTWDHHLLDVETLALPLIATGPERPRSLAKTCEALGVGFDRDQAHGALYDVRLAKAVFDRVWELLAALGNDEEPVAASAPSSPPLPAAPAQPNLPEEAPPEPEEPPAPPESPIMESPPGAVPLDPPPVLAPGDGPADATAAPVERPESPVEREEAPRDEPASPTQEFLEAEPEVYEREEGDAGTGGPGSFPPSGHDSDEESSTHPGDGGAATAPDTGYQPIRPLDAPLPPRQRPSDPTAPANTQPERELGLPAAPPPDLAPEPAPAASSDPFPRRKNPPLVEEAVTVLPPDGTEDTLFGARHKKVGHPGRRDAPSSEADPGEGPDTQG